MISNFTVHFWSAFAFNHVLEGQIIGTPPKSSGLNLLKAVIYLHPRRHRLSKQAPRLIAPSRHRRPPREIFLRVLWSVPATKGAYQPNDLPSKLKTTIDQGTEDH